MENKKRKPLRWVVAVILFILGVTKLPSVASIFYILAAIMVLPIETLQMKLSFYLKRKVKIAIFVIFFVLGLFLPF